MEKMTEDQANKIYQSITLRANVFIEREVTKNFEGWNDRVSADLTVKLALVDAALEAFKTVSGVEYAKVVRLVK